jgi:hypothetical protein
VDDSSDPAFTEMTEVEMRAYEYAPASEPTLTTPSEVLQAIRELKVGKGPGPNGIPNRVLRHLPKRAITLLTKVFNAVLRKQHFPPAWEHTHMVHILKPEKDPTQPSSCRHTNLPDTIGKPFEKFLLSRFLREVHERGCCATSSLGSDPSTARRCSWPALLNESTETLATEG